MQEETLPQKIKWTLTKKDINFGSPYVFVHTSMSTTHTFMYRDATNYTQVCTQTHLKQNKNSCDIKYYSFKIFCHLKIQNMLGIVVYSF